MYGRNETVNFQSQKIIFRRFLSYIKGPILQVETLNLGNHMLFFDNVENR